MNLTAAFSSAPRAHRRVGTKFRLNSSIGGRLYLSRGVLGIEPEFAQSTEGDFTALAFYLGVVVQTIRKRNRRRATSTAGKIH
jgi:hypothetical protein